MGYLAALCNGGSRRREHFGLLMGLGLCRKVDGSTIAVNEVASSVSPASAMVASCVSRSLSMRGFRPGKPREVLWCHSPILLIG